MKSFRRLASPHALRPITGLFLALFLCLLAVLPASAQRHVTVFYFPVFGDSLYQPGALSPTGDSWIMRGQSPWYGPGGGTPHFWGKPLWAATHGDGTIKNNYRFYLNGNPNQPNNALLDWHADLLTGAGVDFITLDITNGFHDYANGPTYISATKALCKRWSVRMAAKWPTPKIAFFVYDEATLQAVQDQVFNAFPPELFFNYLGKKLVLVAKPFNHLGQGDAGQPAVPTHGLFGNYTTRHCWGLDNSGSCWQFKVNSNTPPPAFHFNGQPEQVCAPVSTQTSYMTQDGVNLTGGAVGRQGGAYFRKYRDHARASGAKFVFIHSWNEWFAGNWGSQAAPTFVDQWLTEWSSDIEPMAGGHGWEYFDLMEQKISEFRGNGPLREGRTYVLRARHSGKCAEVGGAATGNGANVNQYQIWNPIAACQRWTAYEVGGGYWKFVNVNSGKVLEVSGYSNANSANVQQWDWVNHHWQQWSVVDAGGGYFKLVNRGSGQVLDVEGGAGAVGNGVNISQFPDLGGANQQWAFDEVSPLVNGTTYSLVAAHSGKAAEVYGWSQANGGAVVQYTNYGNANQRWTVGELGGPNLAFTNVNSGRVMEVAGTSTASEAIVQQWQWVNSPSQQWLLVGVDVPGRYIVYNRNSGLALDLWGGPGNQNNGAKIQQYPYIGGLNQQWNAVP